MLYSLFKFLLDIKKEVINLPTPPNFYKHDTRLRNNIDFPFRFTCVAKCNGYGLRAYLGTLAVRTGLSQVSLGSRVLGSRHHLHRLCDLLDVLHRLESHRDSLEGGHTPGLLVATETNGSTHT